MLRPSRAPPTIMQINISEQDVGKRFDAHVAAMVPALSRSRIKKMIEAGEITLNGKVITPHRELRAGDVIEIADNLSAVPAPAKLEPRPDIALEIVHEDEAVAVVNKPSGLLMHPTVRNENETLAHALVARWPQIAAVGESWDRPGIMHRLDKEASGLIVVAKTQPAYENLKKQFQEHTITKVYAVLVHDAPPKDEGTISLAIGRSASGDKMAARPAPMEGDRQAVTHYRIEKRFRDATLLTVRTETGRTHQIRAHFKALGCPVVGDPLYHRKQGSKVTAPRLFLHAFKLGFNHPTSGEKMEFNAPLPAELETALAKLGSPTT